ncbi:MAG: autotransporter domain-containing protein [Planctomycetota bacterium]|nr:autotransporter domain-containing protein [Planctomycetota bacterium]
MTAAQAQVISAQSAATLNPADFRASTRLQYGLTQPQTYQGAILGGARINSDQQAVIAADGGFTASTNPPFWSQAAGNTFQLSYTASTQTLTMRVLRPSGAQQFSISDTVNLTGAGGLNLDFAALNLSTFGGIQLTSAGHTVALGPNGLPWSSTDLARSTLTGWNLGADWGMTGSVLFRAGGDAVPRLQGDILAPGLAYQLSHVSGDPRQQVYNYGIISDMVVSDTDFLQSTFGGTDGIIEVDISSAAAVTFDIASNQQYSGSITDLTTSLVASQYRGTASLVKRGIGTLTLTEASTYSGDTTIEDGALAITSSDQLGAGAIIFGNGSGAGTPVLAVDLGGGTDTLTRDVMADNSNVTLDVAPGTLTVEGTIFDVGANDLVKRGAGTLVLNLAGGYRGTLDVQAGTVAVGGTGAVGDAGIRIGGDASVRFDIDFSSAVGQDLAVLGDATVYSDTNSTLEWNTAMTSAATDSLEVRGLTMILNGDASALLGGLDVNDTHFTMDGGHIGSSVIGRGGSFIDASGTIDGDLTINDAALSASGGDGSRPGALNVGGSLSLAAAATLRANLFLTESAVDQRESDRVTVVGSASMGGALVAVHNANLAPGALIPGVGVTKTWQLISSPGTGTGAFSSATLLLFEPGSGDSQAIALAVNGSVSFAAVRITTVFDALGATISMTGTGPLPPDERFKTPCGTVTGAEINGLVDHLRLVEATGTPDAAEIAALLLLEKPEDLPASYAATQQRNPYATPSVIMDSNYMAGQTAMLRLMQMRDGAMGSAAVKAADASGGQAPQVQAQEGFGAPLNGPTPDEGARAWTRGYGFWENVDGNPCTDCGYDASIGAALVGMDWAVDSGGIIGGFAGLGPGQISMNTVNGSQYENVTTVMAGIYGSWVPVGGGSYISGFGMGGYNSIDRTRNIDISAVDLNRTATSSNDAWSLSFGGEAGLNLKVNDETTLQPYVGVAWAQYWGGSYNEQGADSLNLQVDSQSANQWQPTVGTRLLQEFKIGRDILTPYIGAGFIAQIPVGAGWTPTYTSDFNLGEPTKMASSPEDRYGANFQAGIQFATIKGVTAYIAFDGAAMTDKQRYGGQVGLLVPF